MTTTASITAQANNAFSNHDMCAFCDTPGVCSGSLIFNATGFGYICYRCATKHAPELVHRLFLMLANLADPELLARAVKESADGFDPWTRPETDAEPECAFCDIEPHGCTHCNPFAVGADTGASTYGPDYPQQEHYWGCCPTCHQYDGYINIGRGHWFYCGEHKIRWCTGSNLFSTWQNETDEEQRERYDALDFGNYTTVTCEESHCPEVKRVAATGEAQDRW
jgi:hypothetical protein